MSELNLMLVQQNISDHMNKIASYFKSGAKITVMVRSPGFPDRDFMMTNDLLPELTAMIERRTALSRATEGTADGNS